MTSFMDPAVPTAEPEPIQTSSPRIPLLGEGKRKLSIQFDKSTLPPRPRTQRSGSSLKKRSSSPPPAPKFNRGVSFDTFEKKGEPTTTSFTIQRKHIQYNQNKSTRTFLCGIDDNDYSNYALEWLLDELVDDNDQIVCLRVVDKDSTVADSASLKLKSYKAEAEKLMTSIEERNHDNKAISLILEFAVGKVEKLIMSMIKLYEPSLLIVGTKGRNLGGIQGLLPGSISKFCLQNSPIPVIVVRPNAQRARGKRKRQADKTRDRYRDLLDKSSSGEDGIQAVSHDELEPTRDEAAAVAEALGVAVGGPVVGRGGGSSPLVKGQSGSPLVQVQSAEEGVLGTSVTLDRDDSVAGDEKSPGASDEVVKT